MSPHKIILLVAFILSIYMIIQDCIQMNRNIKVAKHLEHIRKRLAFKEAKIDLLVKQVKQIAKTHATGAEI